MRRKDPEYWQRLRRDKRSAVAGLLTAAAAVVATSTFGMMMFPGSHYEARANPFYWLLLIPMAWWVSSLANYEPTAVRSWKAVLAMFCILSTVSLILAIRWERDITLTAVSCGLTLVCALASMVAYRGSLVAREGPAR